MYAPEEKEQAKWRIPIGDSRIERLEGKVSRAPENEHSHSKDGYEFAKEHYGWDPGRSNSPMSFSDDHGDLACFIARFKRVYNSHPFCSKEGYVGLCPKQTQPGDRIAIFMGERVLYIIRRQFEDDTWTLIGESHVYGIMDGEFIDTDSEPAFETITLV